MLSEVFAAGLGYVIGWAALRSFIRQTGLTFVVLTSLPAGAAIWVFCAAWLQALPILYSPSYPSVIAFVIAVWLSFKSHLAVEKYEVVAFVVGLCMIGFLTMVFSIVDVTTVGSDDFWTIYMANEIQLHGRFSTDTRFLLLSKEPLFQALIQSGAPAFGKAYFTALQPLFGILAIAVFLVLIYQSLHATGVTCFTAKTISLAAAVAVATTPIVIVHALTLKTHGIFMLFFLVAFAALYLAQIKRSETWFLLAMFFVSILIFVRLEAAITVFPFLIAAVSANSIDFRRRTFYSGCVATIWAAWFLYLSIATAYSDHLERSQLFKAYLLVVVVLLAFAGFVFLAFGLVKSTSRRPWAERAAERTIEYLPKLMVAVLLLSHVVYVVYSQDQFVGILRNYVYTLYSMQTGALGVGTALGIMLIMILRKRSWADQLSLNTYVLIGITLVLPFTFATEAVYAGDGSPMLSSARVLVQFFPAIVFWLVLRLGTVTNRANGVSSFD